MSKTMSRFAHLVGLRARAEEPDQEDQNADNEDQENAAEEDQDAEDPEEQNGRAKGKKAKAKRAKAEEDTDAEEDNDADAEDEGDDETDAEDQDDDTTAQARARERGRCAAIFGCKAAANNPALAAELAFGTKLPRNQAIRVLKTGGISKPASSNKPSRTALYDQRIVRSRQSLGMDVPQPSQLQSKREYDVNFIMQSAMKAGIKVGEKNK